MEETKAVFAPLRKRISDAVQKLEEQIAISESGEAAAEGELEKAKEALAKGQELVKDDE
jgi:tubulin-specific chaperone A